MCNLVKSIVTLLLFLNTSAVKSDNAGLGGDYPVYDAAQNILTLPRVDTSDQVGRYQNVVFRLDAERNVWILESFQSRKTSVSVPEIKFVFPLVESGSSSILTQAALSVDGDFICGRIGQVNQRRTGDLFEIQITQDPLQPGEVCDQIPRIFQRLIKLDVSRLEAGEYRYNINNGARIGTFTLPIDTIVPDECGGSPESDEADCGLMFTGEVVESRTSDQGGYPVYNADNGMLALPRIDTSDQVAQYQDVIFRFDSRRNVWILESFRLINAELGLRNNPIIIDEFAAVTLVDILGVFPLPQVSIHVSGEYTCGRIGQINQRRTGNRFEIQITHDPLQPDEVCDQVRRTFRRVIQLDVSHLVAGRYQYTINDFNNAKSIREFLLPVDTFPTLGNECGGSVEDNELFPSCGLATPL